jgi:hypothetical protein
MKLKEKIGAEIAKQQFNHFEVLGFQANPQLALVAGALIGYRLAMKEVANYQLETDGEGYHSA